MKGRNTWVLIGFIAVSEFAGVIGSLFTLEAIPTWYAALQKPSFSPPNWLFGPVWTTLYLLMGIAAYLVWREGSRRYDVHNGLFIFVLQLVLNAVWSIVFFGMHSIMGGLIVIALLWLSIVWTMVAFYKVKKSAAYLLIPYIAWVSFASVLNYALYTLN
jgi:benzodiazapine receptor